LKEQLVLLYQLQKIDSRVQEVRASIKALPEKLQPAVQDLAKLESMLQMEKDGLADTEAWRRDQEGMIKADEDSLRKAKAKLQAAKSTKDYSAASREVDTKRRNISEREDEVLKVIDAIDTTRAQIEAHQGDVDNLRTHVEAEQARIQERVSELETEATEHATGRDEIANKLSDLDKRTLKRYDLVMRRRRYAMAPVIGGVCQGCHMSLPPQLNNVLARGDSIETCPRCNRIVYRKELFDLETDDNAAEAAAAE
jgi:hypothetical protein